MSDQVLVDAIALTTMCVRTYESLFDQYKECRYGESYSFTAKFNEEGELYNLHKPVIERFAQRPLHFCDGCYGFYIGEYLYIVCGQNEILCDLHEKIEQSIVSYYKNTCNITPTVIWCCFAKYYNSMYSVIKKLAIKYNLIYNLVLFGPYKTKVSLRFQYVYRVILSEESKIIRLKDQIVLKTNNDDIQVSKVSFITYILVYLKRLTFS